MSEKEPGGMPPVGAYVPNPPVTDQQPIPAPDYPQQQPQPYPYPGQAPYAVSGNVYGKKLTEFSASKNY